MFGFRTKVANRIYFAVGVSVVALIAFAILLVMEHQKQATQVANVARMAEFSGSVSSIVHELQRERGATAGFVSSGGLDRYRAPLDEQRRRTDTALNAFRASSSAHDASRYSDEHNRHFDALISGLERLPQHRASVDSLDLELGPATGYFTGVIGEGIRAFEAEARMGGVRGLTRDLTALLYLIEMKESAGIERAVGAGVFGANAITIDQHRTLHRLQTIQESRLDTFLRLASGDWAAQINSVVGHTVEPVENDRNILEMAGYGASVPSNRGQDWFARTTARIDAMMEIETRFATQLIERANARAAGMHTGVVVALSIAIILTIGAILLSAKIALGIVRPIRTIADITHAVVSDPSAVTVPHTDASDEIGELARVIDSFKDTLIEQEATRAENEAAGRAERERGEKIERLINDFQQSIEDVTAGVSRCAEEYVVTADELTAMSQSSAEKAQTVSESAMSATRNVESVAAATEEMAATVSEIGRRASDSTQASAAADQAASNTVTQVNELAASAQRIGDVIAIIQQIAEQTNLLALNATIEAARAGEAGKGFAIVAHEVKQLAAQTDAATGEIADQIDAIQVSTGGSAQAISAIAEQIANLNEISTSIAGAVEEQTAATAEISSNIQTAALGTRKVSDNISDVAGGLEDASGAAEKVLAASKDLKELSGRLQGEVSVFLEGVRAA